MPMRKMHRLTLFISIMVLAVFLIAAVLWWLVPEIEYKNLLPQMDNKVAAIVSVDWDIVLFHNGTFSPISPPDEKVTDIAWSPDGKMIAYIYTPDFAKTETYLATIDPTTGKSTTISEFDSSIAYSGDLDAANLTLDWSPDGKTIIFDSISPSGAFTLLSYDLRTGSKQTIATFPEEVRSLSLDWSPVPLLLIGTCQKDNRDCKTWSMDPLSNMHNPKFITDGAGVAWLQGGRRILVYRWDQANDRFDEYTCLANGQDARPFISDLYAWAGGWSPDGRYFFPLCTRTQYAETLYIFCCMILNTRELLISFTSRLGR
jgi:WD40 repeat protein